MPSEVSYITREFGIDAGHRVLNHESKCHHPHGHRYRILVSLEAPQLDPIGRVEDFSEVKKNIGGWLEEHWDHAFLVDPKDTELLQFLTERDFKRYILDCPTTVECLCKHLFDVCHSWIDSRVVSITIFETPNCSATYPGSLHS